MSNTLGYLRGELKQVGKKKSVSFGKRVLEIGFIKKILLAVYNKIFNGVNSSGKCNRCVIEHLKGCFETKCFARSEIQFGHCLFEPVVGDSLEVRFLGKVLSQ